MEHRISILIPVFNELQYTKLCLENLFSTLKYYKENSDSLCTFEIVVIDDGSTDGTSSWIKENYPQVILLFGDGNLFWSAGVNKGVEYALSQSEKPSHILFWNKDLFIEETYFIILHDLILKNPENTILASKMYRKSTPDILFSFGGKYKPWTDTKINIGTGQKDGEAFNNTMEIDWCGGMAVTIPAGVFSEIGLCDAVNFPQYDGDTDFFLRARNAGFKLLIFPELKAWNVHENTGRKEKFSLKNLSWYLTNIRSYKNFQISYTFLRKHSKGPIAYLFFLGRYFVFISKYCAKILIHSRR